MRYFKQFCPRDLWPELDVALVARVFPGWPSSPCCAPWIETLLSLLFLLLPYLWLHWEGLVTRHPIVSAIWKGSFISHRTSLWTIPRQTVPVSRSSLQNFFKRPGWDVALPMKKIPPLETGVGAFLFIQVSKRCLETPSIIQTSTSSEKVGLPSLLRSYKLSVGLFLAFWSS